jgi:hypothetical protein
MSWIRIKIYIVPVANGTRVSADEAHRFVDQIKNDALYGTYGTLDAQYWHDRMEFRPESLAEAEIIGEPQEIGGGLAAYEFELRLASALLPQRWEALRIYLECWQAIYFVSLCRLSLCMIGR